MRQDGATQSSQRSIFHEVFAEPTRANLDWAEVEGLLMALGARKSEGRGSLIRFVLSEVPAVFHRPHPQKEIGKGTVRAGTQVFGGRGDRRMLSYQGYLGEVVYDQETDTFHGNVLLARGVVTFEGRSVDELKQAFQDSVDDYLELCRSEGLEPEPPLDGHLSIQVPPGLQSALLATAHQTGKSVDHVIVENLARDLRVAL